MSRRRSSLMLFAASLLVAVPAFGAPSDTEIRDVVDAFGSTSADITACGKDVRGYFRLKMKAIAKLCGGDREELTTAFDNAFANRQASQQAEGFQCVGDADESTKRLDALVFKILDKCSSQ